LKFRNPSPEPSNPKVLVVETEADAREFMATAFECEGYAVELAGNCDDAIELISNRCGEFSAVFLDLLAPGKDAFTALQQIRLAAKDIPVFITSFTASPQLVGEAVRAGVTDFIWKPLTHEDLRNRMLKVAAPAPRPPREEDGVMHNFWGSSRPMREIQSLIRRVGSSDAPVLINGETGAGKEVLAREIHHHSRRGGRVFLKLNCAALPAELVESELFGYERGAFTGAFQRKTGLFEQADHGTILLDEIGDMDYRLQAKLLQVLQDREFQRLGGREMVRVDVRVMAATHRNLPEAIENETFREDLYYRLNVINIQIPPLRERREDVIPLARRFLQKYAEGEEPPLTPELQQAMMEHDWPGNVRELENLIRRYLVFRNPAEMVGQLTLLRHSAHARQAPRHNGAVRHEPVRSAPGPVLHDIATAERHSLADAARAQQEAETAAILHALEKAKWNRKSAARALEIDYKALLYKMKKLNIGN